jgi:hypothetical protein
MIEPSIVTLAAGESAQFVSDGSEWTLSPNLGTFNAAERLYTAPKWIVNSRTVLITTRTAVNPAAGGTAEIHLTSSLFWLKVLALYWPALFVVLSVWGWRIWPGIPPEPVLMVNPPAVTLGARQTQQFSATLNDAPELDFTWSATSGTITPTGFYSPPAPAQGQRDQSATITATRNSDKTKTATSIVILSGGSGLFLYPALSQVQKSGTVTLIADGGDVDVEWPKSAPKGIYTAPAKIDQRQVVSISVTDKKNAGHIAGARIVLLPDENGKATAGAVPSDVTLITLAMLAGALGAWLASVKSFVGFTGTRSFVPSWGFFYLFRPGFGAGLALIVHLAHRMGSVGVATSANNPAVVVFYSALVGLFSEEALQKLHEIFSTIFGVQDKRSDKMGEKGPSGQGPSLTAATASAASREISIDGANFVSSSTVLVDNVARPSSFVNDKKLTLRLDPMPAAGTTIALKVRNPDGKESTVLQINVGP